jgi:hypothetical protein
MKLKAALTFASLALATAAQAASPGTLGGTVNLSPSLSGKIGPDAVLYVIARQGDVTGPPVAVKRITQPFHFPISFSLSSSDSMMGAEPGAGAAELSGKFTISARISQNGSATPKPGDLQTEKPLENVTPGKSQSSLTINQVR